MVWKRRERAKNSKMECGFAHLSFPFDFDKKPSKNDELPRIRYASFMPADGRTDAQFPSGRDIDMSARRKSKDRVNGQNREWMGKDEG